MRKVIILLLSACGITASALAQGLVGDWTGQLNGSFKVRIHFERVSSGFSGKLINPSGNETVLDQITSDGTHLHFAVNKLNLSYDGVWSEEEKAWKGDLTFQQIYHLVLKRATAEEMAPVVHKRPQEDAINAGPAPYVQREVHFNNFAGHNQLSGTLSLPNSKGPFPAVVLVSGTGHNTRDEDVWGHKVFLVLADALNREGFAVLRYDKRGVGGSSGDYDAATTADFASDAGAAVAWLKNQAEIDASRVGVLGHSEGSIIAPAVAAADKSVAFVVMIAGPCIRGDKLFVLQSAMTAKAYGAPDDYIARRKIFDQELYSAILSAPSESAALDRAKARVAQGVADKIVDAQEAESLAKDDTTRWERYFLAYDPAPALARLTVPVLALNGSLDVQVPAKENLAAAREALRNNPKATAMELAGMNHLLQEAKTGAPSEYNDIEETISPAALKIITDWLGTNVLTRPSPRNN
ncbi:MAG TPA: alpha/beta fold hydrolase [Candidatus Acidoferrum sp.]|nr:alpha/beta fold hydrolase [Candidatus Acidoferrum sp.]